MSNVLSRRSGEGWRVLGYLVLVFLGLLSASAAALEPGTLYVREASLHQTMLATRARWRAWQAAQVAVRPTVQVGTWYAASPGNEQLNPDAVTRSGIHLEVLGLQGQPLWAKCNVDGVGNPKLPHPPATYLFTTLHAPCAVALSLELSRHEQFGGFAYRPPPSGAGVQPEDALVWLNGQRVRLNDKLAGYSDVPVAKRRGWHEAILIDLPLVAGENRLLVSLRKGTQAGWFNAIRLSSDPVPALWAMLEQDFPRSRHRLLDTADYAWFEADKGWFAQGDERQLEKALLDRLTGELGADAAALRPAGRGESLERCVTAAELRATLREMDALRNAVQELLAAFPTTYPGSQLLARLADLRQRVVQQAAERLDPADEPSRRLFQEFQTLQRAALVAENPLLKGKELLFVKRYTYDTNHYYDEFNVGISRFGGNLCRLTLDNGAVSEIASQLRGGIFDRYDLSFDARRILFGYKPCQPGGLRILEIGVDGSGLRQVTFPPADEPQRIATYSQYSPEALQQNPCRYGHWTDDMHPCYLPDGRIVFTSTRTERSVLCGGHSLTVTNLHRINADGTGLQPLSQGALSEFCPSVMNDGRILYNRWEYVDKGAGAVQSLWAMTPDASRSEEIYGNNIGTPPVYNQAQHVPGADHLVVCLGAGHCPGNMGAILLIDRHKNKRTEEAMTALTPGCIPKGNWALRQYRNGRWIVDVYGPWYCDPYPLTDRSCDALAGKFFLVSCNPEGIWNDPAGYGLYLLDVFGNRVPIYADPQISCWQARPLKPRPKPDVLAPAPQLAQPAARQDASVFISDVYQGLDGVAPGTVKYVRVLEQIPRPWSAYLGYQGNDAAPGQMVAISLYTHLSIKVLLGVVPVQADGSASFTVPAHRNLFFEALDENFMEIQRMRTFVNFQPGEQRSCVGCHEPRVRAPINHRALALAAAPVQPRPQPGDTGPRPLHYPTDIQPVFDRHCVSCHSQQKPEGGLILTGELTDLFCRSYENLIHKDLVGYIQEFVGPKPEGRDAMGYAPAVPPYTYGSHKSRLISAVRAPHYDVQLPREDFIRLVTWVDANAPYYGSYFGRRNLAHRDRPNFRPVPSLESARGTIFQTAQGGSATRSTKSPSP
jgi:hypothetical protein